MANPTNPHWANDPAILMASRNAPALREGASGSGVSSLRKALLRVGAHVIAEPEERFGALTKAQVSAFQSLYSLTADGLAGAATIGKLDELLTNPARTKPWRAQAPALGKEEFLQKVAAACAPIVRKNKLPVSSMLACAALESGWGTGKIYLETNNLFSMQKWPWVPYPITTRTLWRVTQIQTVPTIKTAKAPFNTATDLADAGRQWCEWILHYGAADGPPGNISERAPKAFNAGAISRRMQLLSMVADPARFARNLYLVSFGESAAMALDS